MKIVVLDGYTANPGDLTWDAIAALGELTVHDRTSASEVVARATGAQIVLTNKTPIDRTAIESLPDLGYIGVLATGYNIVDVAAAHARGIAVCNVPEYSTPNVAQAVWSLILELTNRTGHHARTVAEGRWVRSLDFCYWDYPLVELSGRTLGIVGYGRIGAGVAKVGLALGMRVLAHRRQPLTDSGVESAPLERVLAESDVISLHCPLTPETRHLINAQTLSLMKPGAFLINTARGPLLDEAAVAHALEAGTLGGAGLDVLSAEPPPADNPLLSAPNCIITPHIAWATRDARERLLAVTAENVKAWIAGKAQNLVR